METSAYEKLFGAEEVDHDIDKYVKHARRLYRSHEPDLHDVKRVRDFERKTFENAFKKRRFHQVVADRMTNVSKVLRRGRALAEAGHQIYSEIYLRRWFRLMKDNDTLLFHDLPEENDWALAWLDNFKV